MSTIIFTMMLTSLALRGWGFTSTPRSWHKRICQHSAGSYEKEMIINPTGKMSNLKISHLKTYPMIAQG